MKKSRCGFSTYADAYHAFMIYLINAQVASTKLVLTEATTRIFVDGGFGRNPVFMHLLAKKFEHVEVYAASISQGTALGAALLIHRH